MRYLILILFIFNLASAKSQTKVNNSLSYKKESKNKIKDILSKTGLSYFMNFSGPTLGTGRSDTTFNKFQTGFDSQGRELKDGTHALNAFHALALNYKYSSKLSFTLSYAYDTYHSENVDFIGSDGNTYSRTTKGYQYNPRLTAFLPSFYQNNIFSLSTGIGFEIPLTPSSQESGLDTALILTPSISFKNMPNKASVGIGSLIERYFYQSEKLVKYNNMQTFSMTLVPYFNYQLSNKWQFQSRLEFDWDQKGELSGSNTLNNNMVNTYRVGFAHQFNNKFNWGSYLQAVIDNTTAETTMLGAFIGIRL